MTHTLSELLLACKHFWGGEGEGVARWWRLNAASIHLSPRSVCDHHSACESVIRPSPFFSGELRQHSRWHGYAPNRRSGSAILKFKDSESSFTFLLNIKQSIPLLPNCWRKHKSVYLSEIALRGCGFICGFLILVFLLGSLESSPVRRTMQQRN